MEASTAVPIVKLTLPLFIGTILNWAFFGVLLVQVFIYYTAFPHDHRWSRIGVAVIVLLEVIETVANMRYTISLFGSGWGDYNELNTVGWLWFSVPVMSPLIASIGQGFFAYRIYLIGKKSLYLPILICLISLVQLGGGVWAGARLHIAGTFSALQQTNDAPTSLWLGSTFLCDVVISAGMLYHLAKAQDKEFGSARVSSAVSRILYLTVETGAVCGVFVLADLILFLTSKTTNLHLAACIELSKVYSNSILLIFNSRAEIRHRDSGNDTQVSINLSSSARARQSGRDVWKLSRKEDTFRAAPSPYRDHDLSATQTQFSDVEAGMLKREEADAATLGSHLGAEEMKRLSA
uniref:DUF6534 domain-containing protein n=1 Tax=Mycena chlorophos TaxID=658473 RepID=A0ABQ0LZC8_MYCCL|nr:predicted protein [Mycena chlorophos]